MRLISFRVRPIGGSLEDWEKKGNEHRNIRKIKIGLEFLPVIYIGPVIPVMNVPHRAFRDSFNRINKKRRRPKVGIFFSYRFTGDNILMRELEWEPVFMHRLFSSEWDSSLDHKSLWCRLM